MDPHFGIELGYAGIIFLRAGIGNIQKATDDIQGNKLTTFQPNAGIGLKLKSISIDYAFTDIGNQSQVLYSHVFSLRLDIDKQGY
ncbi:MAG: hypothetical protein IH946_12815 [Bacteroidetes bacterium]|nr:hypothetical protein [Bacteroidota bacterium]